MKQIIIITLLLAICVLNISAQVDDTTKVILQSKSALQLKDSLLFDKKNLKSPVFSPDYNGLYNDSFIYKDEQMNFALNKSTKKRNIFNSSYSKYIIPTALISYGIITRENKSLQSLDNSTNHEVNEHLKIKVPIDDYSQFAPAIAVYGLDIAGIKAKHNFRDRTIVMASSYIIMGAAVQTMKSTIKVWRPDNSNNNSFPSGHTATAFVGAHILFKEYKDVSPWIGIAGYTVAAGTGTLRVLNKKHWVSDVVTGAGIGILSAEAGYMLLPLSHKILGIKETNKSLVITPAIGADNYGIGVVYTF